jgi:predicted protein tyrosine phosphatase
VSSEDSRPPAFPSKILFVCSQNKLRSLTAETIYENFPRYQVKSAGTNPGARIRVTEGLIGWADRIFVMEKNHVNILRKKYREALAKKQLVCLHIPDDYAYMDPDLIAVLKFKLSRYIEIP